MAQGLLDAAGFIFGGAMEGGGKAAKESFAEQMKQQVTQLREENMARIANLYADARQEKGFKHAEVMQEGSQKFTAGESKLQREHGLNLQKDSQAFTGKQSEERMMHEDRARAESNYFTLQMEELKNKYGVERDKATDADARARLEIQYQNSLKVLAATKKAEAESPGTIGRQVLDLEKYGGLTKEKAVDLILTTLSGEPERQKAAMNLIITRLKTLEATGMQVTDEEYAKIKADAFATAGATPKVQKEANGPATVKELRDKMSSGKAPGTGLLETPKPSALGYDYRKLGAPVLPEELGR